MPFFSSRFSPNDVNSLTILSYFVFITPTRLNPGDSYFDILPQHINDTTANYASVCSCIHDNEPNRVELCQRTNPFNVPTFLKTGMTALNLCDRRRVRDIHYSDDLTDQELRSTTGYLKHEFVRQIL